MMMAVILNLLMLESCSCHGNKNKFNLKNAATAIRTISGGDSNNELGE